MTVERLNKQGLKDALSALASISKEINNAERRAEQRLTEADTELNSLRKLRGFVDITIAEHRARLAAVEAAEAAKT